MNSGRLLSIAVLVAAASCRAATFVVGSTADSGPGSLREAITSSNETPGPDFIRFSIPGTPPFSISLLSPLPALSGAVSIDGSSQPGYAGQPIIEVTGHSAGNAVGIRVHGGNSFLKGLVINRFTLEGIRLESSSNTVQNCFIGCDLSGSVPRPNGRSGILVSSTVGTLIGGSNPGEGNVISGNAESGIYLLRGGQHQLLGNRIGVDAGGMVNLGNGMHGIVVYDSCGNTVGGDTPHLKNVLSGNKGSGVVLTGSSSGNRIYGNNIGLDISGAAALGNSGDGITILRARGNLIGSQNVISGNLSGGIYIAHQEAVGNVIHGNMIGLDSSGTVAVGNRYSGVTLNSCGSNYVGSAEGAENFISGNQQDGITFTNVSGGFVLGNVIGLSRDGGTALGNAYNGVSLRGSSGICVSANVISGNGFNGLHLTDGASSNTLTANRIGSDPAGGIGLGNQLHGIRVDSHQNIIGAESSGNVISGNGMNGVWLNGTTCYSNVLQGNLIGTSASGLAALPNRSAGVMISSARNNILGGCLPGNANLISGNGTLTTGNGGVHITGSSARWNLVQGNFIGTDPAGQLSVGNLQEGVYLYSAASNRIAGNLISGNGTIGISVTNADFNQIEGNYLGVKLDGASPLPNHFHGIEIHAGSADNLVRSNRVAFTRVYTGIRIRDGATNNLLRANEVFENGSMEIDLGITGHNANDAGDLDWGGNGGQNHPELTQAISGNILLIKGVLRSQAGKAYRIEFFSNPVPDASGFGGGWNYLGEQVVTTGYGSASAFFEATFNATATDERFITATATDAEGNTSEFSAPVAILNAPKLALQKTSGGAFLVSWARTAVPFYLKHTPSVVPPVIWEYYPAAPTPNGDTWTVTIDPSDEQRFFILEAH